MIRTVCLATVLAAGALVSSAPAATDETATQRVDRFLAAMGGRANWAQVGFVHVEATHDDLAISEPFTNRIWNDFARPRVRFEATNDQVDRRRGIQDGKGWSRRDGVSAVLTAEQVESDRAWWEANIYRTLHRLAIHDPDLSAQTVGANRLEIFRTNGKRLNWFVLNSRGEPMLFGTGDNETGTSFGPLASNGSVKYPKWGAVPDGSWRYEVVRLVSAATAPVDVTFGTP